MVAGLHFDASLSRLKLLELERAVSRLLYLLFSSNHPQNAELTKRLDAAIEQAAVNQVVPKMPPYPDY